MKESEEDGDSVSVKKRRLVSDTAEESQSEVFMITLSHSTHNNTNGIVILEIAI